MRPGWQRAGKPRPYTTANGTCSRKEEAREARRIENAAVDGLYCPLSQRDRYCSPFNARRNSALSREDSSS